MTVTLQNNGRTAGADAITALCDVGGAGSFLIATAAFAATLAVCPMNATAYGNAVNGVAPMNGTPTDSDADNTGTAAVYQARDGNDLVIWDGAVALTGGGDINLPVATRNAALDAILALANGGDIQFATSDTFTTVVATVSCQSTAFDPASGGSAALDVTGMSATASQDATVTFYRIRNSGGTEILRGTVGTGSGDWPWDNNAVVNGQPIVVSNFSMAMPATIASSEGSLVINNIAIAAGQNVSVVSGSYTQPAQLV